VDPFDLAAPDRIVDAWQGQGIDWGNEHREPGDPFAGVDWGEFGTHQVRIPRGRRRTFGPHIDGVTYEWDPPHASGADVDYSGSLEGFSFTRDTGLLGFAVDDFHAGGPGSPVLRPCSLEECLEVRDDMNNHLSARDQFFDMADNTNDPILQNFYNQLGNHQNDLAMEAQAQFWGQGCEEWISTGIKPRWVSGCGGSV
jgi:hypothetical protein